MGLKETRTTLEKDSFSEPLSRNREHRPEVNSFQRVDFWAPLSR